MSEDLIGRSLGSYQIVEKLGLGGMATVYKAYQPSMDRYVAIKVLPRHFAHDPTFTGRFEQEARVIAKLENARILPVYDFGEDDGTTYIVMRYLNAGTLSQRLANGPMPLNEVARILSQIAEALDYAHKQGVIHRDIKPSNILLDESGDAYLTDFGISKLTESSAGFTGSGIVGTPTYISPEQGLGQPLDGRTDIYSLGVVLYQMITADVPFHAETPMGIVIKHINEPMPPPHVLQPDLPGNVEAVVLKALAKRREVRYDSAGEMAMALREAVANPGAPVDGIDEGPATIDLAAPPPLIAPEPTLGTAVSSPTESVPPAEVEKPQRRGWLIAVIGISVCLCLAAFLLIAINRNKRNAAAEGTATPPNQLAEVTNDPLDTTSGAGDVAGDPAADVIGCSADQVQLASFDFEGAETGLNLPADAVITETPGGTHALVVTAATNGNRLEFGPALANASLTMEIYAPEGEPTIALHVRSGPDGSYSGNFEPGPVVELRRTGELLGQAATATALGDGQRHVIAIQAIGSNLIVMEDGRTVIEAQDATPLPAGAFALQVQGATVWIDRMTLCASRNDANLNGVIFRDEFEEPAFNAAWDALGTARDSMRIENGHLTMDVLSGSTIDTPRDGLDSPVLVVTTPGTENFRVRVDVSLAPTQNLQSAGLIVLSRLNVPLFSLTRSFCDLAANGCQGDAIYFTDLGVVGSRAQPHVSGVGSLPGSPVGLMLVFENNRLAGYYSVNQEETWELAGEWPLVDARIGSVGVFTTSNGHETDPLSALFDDFAILSGTQVVP